MKLSELIIELQKVLKQEGDLRVFEALRGSASLGAVQSKDVVGRIRHLKIPTKRETLCKVALHPLDAKGEKVFIVY